MASMPAGQILLKNASILVIGAGALGCPVLLYLAAAGIGKLLISHTPSDCRSSY